MPRRKGGMEVNPMERWNPTPEFASNSGSGSALSTVSRISGNGRGAEPGISE